MDKESESKYLERLGKGEQEAFNILFLMYHSLVKRFLMGFIKEENDVLDITQNIFINVWTHRESIAVVDSFKAYLFRMTRNEVYNYYKLHTLRESHIEQYQQQTIWIDDSLEDKMIADELELLLDITVDNMPPQRKLIFKMSRKEGLSNEEIAQQLNISKRTVENHITQALADLRKVIKIALLFFI